MKEDKKQQLLALGRLGWSLRCIEKSLGVRRETAGDYLREAGIAVRPPGEWGQTADGQRGDQEKNFREVHGAQAYKTIVGLRAKIADILEGFGITVLPSEEWRKPAPGLRGTEETLIGLDGKAIRVLDAFFFESL